MSLAVFFSLSSHPVMFFFSSRRRHTRFKCDWSSDVCSSDLGQPYGRDEEHWHRAAREIDAEETASAKVKRTSRRAFRRGSLNSDGRSPPRQKERSEERRVGKEGRSRGAPDH